MSGHRARLVCGALLLCGCVALIGWLVTSSSAAATGDGAYLVHGVPGADNAGPPIDAIVHGRFALLPRLQTVKGLTSILWRVPFVATATVMGAGARVDYAVGAALCLLPLVWVAGWLLGRDPTWRGLAAAAIAALVMILGTSTCEAVRLGHPEEVLTAVLALGAVINAEADRRACAAVLLGLAIGTSEWALLATPVVLWALPAGRGQALLVICVVAAACSLPLPLLDFHAFQRADASIGPITTVHSMSVWWPLATTAHQLPLGMQRLQAAGIAFALAGGGLALGRLALTRSGAPFTRALDPMALLVLCGLLRCILDPADLTYYFTAAVIPLAGWEVGRRQRLPILSVLFWVLQAACYETIPMLGRSLVAVAEPVGIYVFIAGTVLLAGYLAIQSVCPRASVGLPQPAAAPTPTPRADARRPIRPAPRSVHH